MTLHNISPIRHGVRQVAHYCSPRPDAPVRLNANESPYPPPGQLAALIAERTVQAAHALNRYPDREAAELRAGLARYLTRTSGFGVSWEQVWAGNGANEVMQQLLQAFGGPRCVALGFLPSYSMYGLIARNTHTRWVPQACDPGSAADLDTALGAIAAHRPDMVIVCSPNNPTGLALDAAGVVALYEAANATKPAMIVLDEAYVEFSTRGSLLVLLENRPHLVVLRTMSKAFGAAGLHLGYLAADPAVVQAVRAVTLPYHLSALTQAAAVACLQHADGLLRSVATVRSERSRLADALRAMGLDTADSEGNFLQFGRFTDASAIWQGLLRRGVLARDTGVPGFLRVTVGMPTENDAFLRALRDTVRLIEPGRNLAA